MRVLHLHPAAPTATLVVSLSALLAFVGGPPAPGLPALLARVEVLTGWPTLGLARASAMGLLIAWTAQASAERRGLDRTTVERWMTLGTCLVPATVPGAGVFGLMPSLYLASRLAVLGGHGPDRRVALLLWTAVVTVLVDARVAPAGAVAAIAAAGNLLRELNRGPANDNHMPPFAWRAHPSGYLQGSCPQFISE